MQFCINIAFFKHCDQDFNLNYFLFHVLYHFLGDCDFETGTCSWVNVQSGDDFDWLRGSKGTPSFFTGPDTDHTTGTAAGWYLYVQ